MNRNYDNRGKGLSIRDILILVFFICFFGVTNLLQIINTFIVEVLPFSDEYSLVKYIIENSFSLTKISWIDNILLFVANLLPTIVITILGLKKEYPGWVVTVLSIAIYFLTLYLFSSIVFWIVLGTILISFLVYKIIENYHYKKNSKNKGKEFE